MYLPQLFREDRREVQFDLIRRHPLGLLVSHGGGALSANFVPFLAYPDEGAHGVLRAHVARANAQWRELASGAECLLVFSGPQAYISPNWYPSKAATHEVVPTWNYATVHVWGQPRVIADPAWLHRQISDLTRQQEGTQPERWSVSDAPAAFVVAQLKAIVGIEIAVTRTEGKWKMSQNRNPADRAGVVEGLSRGGHPEVAKLVQGSHP